MERIREFFKSSSLSKGVLIFRLSVGTLISLVFIIGGIYMIITDPRNEGALSFLPFPLLGFILGFFTILWINPKKVEEWIDIRAKKVDEWYAIKEKKG